MPYAPSASASDAADEAERDADPLDRLRPEACEDVEREPRQAKRRVARPALPRRVADVHLDDARAAGEDERLRELLLADRAEHRLDDFAAVGVERTAEVRDVDAGEAPEHPVDHPARQRPAPRVVASLTAPTGDVRARLDRPHELRDVLRLVLEVAVHRDEDLAACAREAGLHRGVLAEVALEADDAHARVGGVQVLEPRERPVARAVVHEEDLERAAVLLERSDRAPVELVDRRLLLEDRDDHGDARRGLRLGGRRGNREHLGFGHRRPEPTLTLRGRDLRAR